MTRAVGKLLWCGEPGEGGNNPAGAGEGAGRREVYQGFGRGELARGARRRKRLDQRMGMAATSEQDRVGDLAQSRGSRGSQLILAVGDRLAQDFAEDRGTRRSWRDANVAGSWAGKAWKPTRSIAFSSARLTGTIGRRDPRVQAERPRLPDVTPRRPSASLRLHCRGTGALRVLVPGPDGDGVAGKLHLMAVEAPGGVR